MVAMATQRSAKTRNKTRARTASSKSAATPRRAAAKRDAAGAAGAGGRARTIIYVHGIGNKPLPETLKCQWDEALFGFNLGERSRLAYWVNRLRYPEPVAATCKSADATQPDGVTDPAAFGINALGEPVAGVEPLIPQEVSDARARRSLARIAEETTRRVDVDPRALGAASYGPRILPLPRPLRELITRRITKLFLKDVNDFLFVEERREAMRRSLRERLATGGGPFVVIGHSQGSMVAYDVLSALAPDEFDIELFVTIGSPLGLTEVQDRLRTITGQPKRLAVPRAVKRWVNVSDPFDPVCADKRLAEEYRASGGVAVEDCVRLNADSPRDPHSGTGYLRLDAVREPVLRAVDQALFQRIAPFTIARDLANAMESLGDQDRYPVLIELRNQWHGGRMRAPGEVRAELVAWIERAIAAADPPETPEDIDLEVLTDYVSAKLTRAEVERLSAELGHAAVYRMFRNAAKRALLTESIDVVQASMAHRGYRARGEGITWAVLDSGIDPHHPHFHGGTEDSSIQQVFDCLKPGPVREWHPRKNPDVGLDRHGHGTHVAGIIAGSMDELSISGIAPAARLISYKVLDDDGRGSDAKIIKALDHIHELNRASGTLVVHGVNLSLGGPFDPQVFGCGDTPVCKQLRKLWRQGVVVVLAAGNEGYLELGEAEMPVGLNMDLSIGDPANLEESIAVGSIHKSKPHLYGVSYFSSRGPTADGRGKPDLVAPGERILSCRAGADPHDRTLESLYIAMSGTSMAAPHVSGIIACWLSARREFIGYPDRVKTHLLAHCTDLKRDRMHQGAGMPNLVKMLLGS